VPEKKRLVKQPQVSRLYLESGRVLPFYGVGSEPDEENGCQEVGMKILERKDIDVQARKKGKHPRTKGQSVRNTQRLTKPQTHTKGSFTRRPRKAVQHRKKKRVNP